MLSNGTYEAVITIVNRGKGTAQKFMMTVATMRGATSTQVPPAAIQDIAPGRSSSSVFDFPASAAAPGLVAVLKFAEPYTGGDFSGSVRLTLPAAPATD